MNTREDNPGDWFHLAQERLRGADALRKSEGVTYLGVEALHEAVERYLKGYLVSKGDEIPWIHDLSALLDRAVAYDPAFKRFADLSEKLTDQFWAQHYPGGDLSAVGADYDELREQAGKLVALIQASIPPSSGDAESSLK